MTTRSESGLPKSHGSARTARPGPAAPDNATATPARARQLALVTDDLDPVEPPPAERRGFRRLNASDLRGGRGLGEHDRPEHLEHPASRPERAAGTYEPDHMASGLEGQRGDPAEEITAVEVVLDSTHLPSVQQHF